MLSCMGFFLILQSTPTSQKHDRYVHVHVTPSVQGWAPDPLRNLLTKDDDDDGGQVIRCFQLSNGT